MDVRKPTIDMTDAPLLVRHDQACAVCHEKKAVFNCQTQVFGPCWGCLAVGWEPPRKMGRWRRLWAAKAKSAVHDL